MGGIDDGTEHLLYQTEPPLGAFSSASACNEYVNKWIKYYSWQKSKH